MPIRFLEKSSINCLNSQFYYYICINAFSFHVNVIIVAEFNLQMQQNSD